MRGTRTILIAAVLLLVLTVGASAAMTSCYIDRELSFTGTSANCYATIIDSGKSIEATMELWCGNFPLALWSDTGTTRVDLDGSVNVASGMTYTLYVYGTTNGVPFSAQPLIMPN